MRRITKRERRNGLCWCKYCEEKVKAMMNMQSYFKIMNHLQKQIIKHG